MKETDIQIQEAQSSKQDEPREAHTKKYLIKMAEVKDKELVFKAARMEKQVKYKGSPVRLSANFSEATLQAGKEGRRYSKCSKKRISNLECFVQQGHHLQLKEK